MGKTLGDSLVIFALCAATPVGEHSHALCCIWRPRMGRSARAPNQSAVRYVSSYVEHVESSDVDMNGPSHSYRRRRASPGEILLRVVVAACLAYSAYVHIDLHSQYRAIKTDTLSQSDIFVIQAIAASVAAALVLFVGRVPGATIAFLVSAASLAAVLVYRYYDVGTIGPLPNMYEPVWFTEKSRSAIAEGIATALSLMFLVALTTRPRGRRPTLSLPKT
jgi:hypothetical protein